MGGKTRLFRSLFRLEQQVTEYFFRMPELLFMEKISNQLLSSTGYSKYLHHAACLLITDFALVPQYSGLVSFR